MATGWLVRRDASDGLDRLECLEHLRHVDAEPLALGVPAGGANEVARPVAESQATRGGQLLEPALEAYGVVVGGDEGVQLLLLLANRAALLDVGADRLHAAREVFLALGGEPLFGEAALELLRAAEFAEDQVQLAHDQLEQLDLPVEQLEDVGLDGPRGREVHDVDLARLPDAVRSEEHTSELQSLAYLVCRLLLEKKKKTKIRYSYGSHTHYT